MASDKDEKKQDMKTNFIKDVMKYSTEELSKVANTLFGVQPECVKAAFFYAGKTEATQSEAIKIVKEFMSREVK